MIIGRLLAAVLLCCCGAIASEPRTQIHLSEEGLRHARELIERGQVINDRHGEWKAHHPSAVDQNGFIRAHGFEEYARWHLAIDQSHAATTKAHYKFPYGDFKTVHRCALLAAKSRAHQYGYADIEDTVAQLLQLVEARQRVSQPTQ